MANDDNVLDRRSSYSYGETAPDVADEMGGTTAHSEVRGDMDSYFRPLERVHGSALHGSGIARGLQLATSTIPAAGPCLLITPGTALDSKGRHLSLAFGGWADKTPTEQPDPQNADNLVAVDADGLRVVAPAEAVHSDSQQYYVILSWLETPTTATAVGFPGGRTPAFPQKVHSPHVFFKKVAELPADSQAIVLGVVSWTAAGVFTIVSQERRRAAQVPIGEYGFVGSLPDGGVAGAGVAIAVPRPNDRIVLRTQDAGAFDLVEGKGRELSVNGTLRAKGGLSVSSNLTLEGTVGLTVNGPLVAKSGLTVETGLSTFSGGLKVEKEFTISGFDNPANNTAPYTITKEQLRKLTSGGDASGLHTHPQAAVHQRVIAMGSVEQNGTVDGFGFTVVPKAADDLEGHYTVIVEPAFLNVVPFVSIGHSGPIGIVMVMDHFDSQRNHFMVETYRLINGEFKSMRSTFNFLAVQP